MPIFQIGVVIEETRCTDLIVRVNAHDLGQAQELALRLSRERASRAYAAETLFVNDADWESVGVISVNGLSGGDYSDMSESGYPADLDFSDRPLPSDPRQLNLLERAELVMGEEQTGRERKLTRTGGA